MRRLLRHLFWRLVPKDDALPKGWGFIRYSWWTGEEMRGGMYALMPFNVVIRAFLWLKWKVKMPRWFAHDTDVMLARGARKLQEALLKQARHRAAAVLCPKRGK